MDVDAFFRAQDQRMNEPEDDMDEFLERMTKARSPLHLASFDSISFDDTPTNAVPEQSYREASDHLQHLPSVTPKEPTSVLIPSSTVDNAQPADRPSLSILVQASPPINVSIPIRTLPPASIPHLSSDYNSASSLKRKESPTKPDKPARKKTAIDPSIAPSSPIEVSPKPISKVPPSRKSEPKPSTSKATRPSVKIPPAPLPETIDLSVDSPIEDPDFSVLVGRFQPEATSTQPKVKAKRPKAGGDQPKVRAEQPKVGVERPKIRAEQPKVGAEPSTFLQMLERTAKKREKRDEALPRRARQSPKVSAPCHGGTISEDESIISISTSSRPSSPPPIRKLTKPSAKPPPKPKPVVQSKSVPPKKGKKKEKVKMYPKDYAQMLLDQPPDPSAKRRQQFLKGMNIFYTGGDMTWASDATRGRMDLIVQHGGNLFPVFDPALVTHIISETSSPEPMLRALGLKKLGEVPDHIPIVKWNWVVSGQEGALGPLWEFAAYANRIPPIDVPVRSGKGKERAIVADQSRISAKQRKRSIHDSEDEEDDERQGPQVGPLQSPPSSRRLTARTDGPSTSRVKTEAADDPLAEFYAKARFDRDNAWSRHGEAGEDEDETDIDEPASDSDDDTAQKPGPPPPKGGWTCDSKEAQVKNGPNEFIAKKLEELMHLHKAKPGMDNHWRAFSYTKALRPIRKHPKPIRSYSEARKIKGVAHKTALKIMEIVETGDLRRIGYENTADVQIRKLFQGIYGVGQQTAYQWYAAGCRSLKDLKAGKGGVTLTPAQKIGIEFYDDINDRMPREEAQALFELIKPIALEINPKLEVEIMGSYRRGKADCGDIDIMITRCPDDGKTHAGILHHLLKALHEKNIITEDLALPEDPFDNEAIYRGLCRLPKFGSRRRRIDFLTVPWKSRGAALLYYTGDDIFNRSMRLKANRLGYSLNQKGLFAGVVRDPRNRTVKTNTGNIVASETEEEIFRMLGVPFQLPHQRVRG